MNPLAQLDHQYVWHPFTQMRDWLKREPIVIVEGNEAVLRDAQGREYLDANSSIWTNLHGHNHPKINQAISRQLKRIAHSSALGFANEPASLLAAKLVKMANAPKLPGSRSTEHGTRITKVFFSDDGSTAMEVALKLGYEFARRTGRNRKPKFLSLAGAYHGDTIGAVSLGHIDLFHSAYSGLLFKSDKIEAPYCYRCPYNRAKPERADAREYRKCNWECLDKVEQKFRIQKKRGNPYAGFVFEPLIQGAAGMIPQPTGWLGRASEIARGHGALLIADEVLTAFGRATDMTAEDGSSHRLKPMQPSVHPLPIRWGEGRGEGPATSASQLRSMGRGTGASASKKRPATDAALLASHQESVQPDLAAIAKGLTGGYLPMAATLTSQAIFDAFLGEYEEFKTFFHGHSYTANQLGAAAALASLDLLNSRASLDARTGVQKTLRDSLKQLWSLPNVGDIRQVGSIVGIELVRNWRTRRPFALAEQAGIRVCQAMARRGVLTRPIGNVIVLMPPFCATKEQLHRMVAVLAEAIANTFDHP